MDELELYQLATERRKMFRNLVAMKAKFEIEISDIFIFLGLGLLNFERANIGPMNVQPISVSSLSDFLAMPKETVRRKLSNLEHKELVSKTGYGFVVKDVGAWRNLAEATNL
ncbi:MAG: hypothetical protein JO273_01415 [Methylobacteriaceae bacterium]|nr:hypothetical protein [Methylobacteriaceae bacterium]